MSPYFTIAADHPSLPGHFPGRPVVPGVVLLDHVVEAALAAHPGRRVSGLPSVKFLHPVLPGDAVEVTLAAPAGARVGFVCRVAGADALRGTLLLADPA